MPPRIRDTGPQPLSFHTISPNCTTEGSDRRPDGTSRRNQCDVIHTDLPPVRLWSSDHIFFQWVGSLVIVIAFGRLRHHHQRMAVAARKHGGFVCLGFGDVTGIGSDNGLALRVNGMGK